MVDIVDHVCDLPYLVLVVLFPLLPLDRIVVYRECHVYEVRRLARAQRWRRVEAARTGYEAEYPTVSFLTFDKHIANDTPPPFPILHLVYSCYSLESVFMTPSWCNYVATHTRSVTLDGMRVNGSRWVQSVPYFHAVNLVGMRLYLRAGQLALIYGELPRSLRRLELELRSSEDAVQMAIPASVLHLGVYRNRGIRPYDLPALPSGLRSLRISLVAGCDVSEFVGVVPSTLQEWYYEQHGYSTPPMISSTALYFFPALLRHNFVIYRGGQGRPDISGLVVNSPAHATWFKVDLNVPCDYSRVQLPRGHNLRVFSSSDDGHTPVPFRSLNHWFTRLDRLLVYASFSMRGLRVPTNLRVTVDCIGHPIPPEVWDMRGLEQLNLDETAIVHGSTTLRTMARLTKIYYELRLFVPVISSILLPPMPVLQDILISLRCLPANHGFSWIQSTTRCVELLCYTHASATKAPSFIDTSKLPSNMVSLYIQGLYGWTNKAPWRAIYGTRTLYFDVFTSLQNIQLADFGVLYFGLWKLPDSVQELLLRDGTVLMDGVRFPPKLCCLKLSRCVMKSAWVSRSMQLAEPDAYTPVVYPNSLRRLEFLFCHLAPPPENFAFPPRLYHLGMCGCSIKSLEPYLLPSSLKELDLLFNSFPVPTAYYWPQLTWILLLRGLFERTPQSLEPIRRQIPGARIL